MSAPKFKEKYRIPSARLKGYDYSSNGAYFITICTANRDCFFGKIENGKMILNGLGQLVQKFWNVIPEQFPFIFLDDMVVMPNHIHGVLWIDNNDAFGVRGAINRVSTKNPTMNSTTGGITGQHNPMFHKNISRVIRWYKGRCTFEINKAYADTNFGWQSRFYDHIIRNKEALNNIRHYILNNPKTLERDSNNKG
ncbi:MAG: transposase [Winogradskyella sp.]